MVQKVTLDSGVLSRLSKGDARSRAHLEAFRRHDVEVVIPAVVIAESTTGESGRDAQVNRVISGCRVEATTEQIARRAASLRFQAKRPRITIDAIVIATAEAIGGGAVLTEDLDDLRALAQFAQVRVERP